MKQQVTSSRRDFAALLECEMAVISAITAAVLIIFGLLDMASIVREIFRRRAIGSDGAKEPRFVRRQWIFIHLAVYVLIILGFWAIIHFGPLRPVHEWLR